MDITQYGEAARQQYEANATARLEARWVAAGGQPGSMPSPLVPHEAPAVDPIDRALTEAIGHFDVVAPGQLAKLLRDDLVNDGGHVRAKDGRSVAETIHARLSADFAHFARSQGPRNVGSATILQARQRQHEARETAAREAKEAAEATKVKPRAAEAPRNLGEAVVNVWNETRKPSMAQPRGFGPAK